MRKFIVGQALTISDSNEKKLNRLSMHVEFTENDKESDKAVENVVGFCNNSIKNYMDSIKERGVENGIKE